MKAAIFRFLVLPLVVLGFLSYIIATGVYTGWALGFAFVGRVLGPPPEGR